MIDLTTNELDPEIVGHKPLILVVDDQPANIQTLGALLVQAGYDVMPATSGEQALARARTRMPVLILLDVLMPEMDGFAVLAVLRADELLKVIPVIFITAAQERDWLVRAFDAGAVDYVIKPFVHAELLARVRAHSDLTLTRSHLERKVRECDDLTQIVAHDLKGPLSGIQFSAALLRARSESMDQRCRTLIESIDESAEEALHFIQRYLGQRADGELKRHLKLEPVELAAIVARVKHDLTAAADSRGMQIHLEMPEPLKAQADAIALRHVLHNLVSNAVKYAPADSAIDIVIALGRRGFVKVSVLDRGPGISAGDQSKLFKRYVRLGAAEAQTDRQSSGLGLAIAKQEVGQMGGALWYELRHGGGSNFSFELPLTS